MKIISKLVKAMKCEWVGTKDGKEVEMEQKVSDVKVTVANSVEPLDLINWSLQAVGYDPIEGLDGIDMETAEFKSLAGVERLVASQLKQHEASSATRSKAVEFCKGEITRAGLDEYVYTHDYTKVAKVAKSAKDKAIDALKSLSVEDRKALMKLMGEVTEEEESDKENE